MPAQTDGERLDRLEQIVQVLAEDQVRLQNLIANLTTETGRAFDRVSAQFEEVAKRMRETDERIDKMALEYRERSRYFDERVDKLVVAIGEFIRRENGSDR